MKTIQLHQATTLQIDWLVAKCGDFYDVHLLNAPTQIMVQP